ncbi:interferon-inducible GTPase 5-like [Larimichthys crocea]|uniref:interferon-inducible GTPase 5-like n=1 Tax=Larimichthys crocea TaxID=215358 RepID=UPI000F5DC0CF|nr:interferon-inducible GTPase 5-like [Larimichthys crocea]
MALEKDFLMELKHTDNLNEALQNSNQALAAEKIQEYRTGGEQTLAQIRENCIQGLQEQKIASPQVFLISSFDLHLYDFHLLEETLERELPEHKRNALLFAMPNISLEIINKKKMAFQDKIQYYAFISGVGAAVPVPGLSVDVDVALLVDAVSQYVFGIGFDTPSLAETCRNHTCAISGFDGCHYFTTGCKKH